MNIIDFRNSAIATMLAEIATLPICTTKTNYQNSNYTSIKETVKKIYKDRGLLGFYKASLPSIGGQVFSTASKFTIYKYLNSVNDNYWFSKYLNGALGGIAVSLVTHPIDSIKVHMQMDTKQIFKKISENPYMLYSGYSKSFTKAAISGPLFFPICDYFSKKFNSVFYGSLSASIIATILMQPIDFLKTIQIYQGHIIYNKNPLVYFKGLHLNLMRIVPHFTIVMTTIDFLNKYN